jgi:hypothetical protein
MFSANENIALRQHKRRVIEYVEECIPEELLDLGATAMAMQVSCNAPGCVPLETVLLILFPKSDAELLEGIAESKDGGTLKTKVLLPMADITKHDVVQALPPPLGTRSMEKLCFQARDFVLAHIAQLVGEEDEEGRRLMADYLISCLEEYKQRHCVAPEYGMPFHNTDNELEKETTTDEEATITPNKPEETPEDQKPTVPAGNFVFRRNEDDGGSLNISAMNNTKMANGSLMMASADTNGNDVVKTNEKSRAGGTESTTTTISTTMDWRRRQTVERNMNSSFSQSIISRLEQRQHHAPGVRRAACPCCDPDNVQNYVDSIMML